MWLFIVIDSGLMRVQFLKKGLCLVVYFLEEARSLGVGKVEYEAVINNTSEIFKWRNREAQEGNI